MTVSSPDRRRVVDLAPTFANLKKRAGHRHPAMKVVVKSCDKSATPAGYLDRDLLNRAAAVYERLGGGK